MLALRRDSAVGPCAPAGERRLNVVLPRARLPKLPPPPSPSPRPRPPDPGTAPARQPMAAPGRAVLPSVNNGDTATRFVSSGPLPDNQEIGRERCQGAIAVGMPHRSCEAQETGQPGHPDNPRRRAQATERLARLTGSNRLGADTRLLKLSVGGRRNRPFQVRCGMQLQCA